MLTTVERDMHSSHMRQRRKLNKPRRCSMEQLSVDKKSRLMLPGQEELEHQEELAVEVPEVVDVEDQEDQEARVEVLEEDMATGEVEVDMEEREVAADMVAVEVVIGKEVMEEVQSATIGVEVASVVEVVDMAVVVMDVEAVAAAMVVAMKEDAEEVKEHSTARVSRQPAIRDPNALCSLAPWLTGTLSSFSQVGVGPHWWFPGIR